MARFGDCAQAIIGLEGRLWLDERQIWPVMRQESVINGGHIFVSADCPHPA